LTKLDNRLRELRAREDVTQKQLADMVGVRRETISHIERNRYTPSLELAFRIARVFEADVEDVFTWEQ